MSLLKAIEKVLSLAEKPQHVNEIYKAIKEQNLWQSSSKTPLKSISARLYTNINKHGDASLFEMVAPQTFKLRKQVMNEFDGQSTSPVKKDGLNLIPETDSAKVLLELSSPPTESMTFTDCAHKVLELFSDKEPMHYRDITSKALENGWLDTKGKTPELTMNAQVNTETNRMRNRGELPRFVLHGKGYIGLRKWQDRGLSSHIEQHNQEVRKKLRDRLMAMEPKEFEKLTSQLLAEIRFIDVEQGTYQTDGGIDVRGELTVGDVVRLKLAVQVKRWKRNVPAPIVRNVRGSLGAHEQGLIITTSDFGKGAKEEAAQADKSPIALMNGDQLVLLLMEHGIGVNHSTPNLFEIDEESSVWNQG